MLKKTITYTDPFTDVEKTEDFYFHISKADLIEMEMTQPGGMQKYLENIIANDDRVKIMQEFKRIIRISYGEKVGDRFLKTEDSWQAFSSGEAYSSLFFELCTDAEKAAEFINGIIPRNLGQEAAKIADTASQGVSAPATQSEPTPEATPALEKAETALSGGDSNGRPREIAQATPENPVVLTGPEVAALDADELKSGLATGRYKLS